jgi:hypothetical protein
MSFGSPVNRRGQQEIWLRHGKFKNDPAWATEQGKIGESVAKGTHVAENTIGIRGVAINRLPWNG